mgnify:CR=1 FL=1
MSKPPSNDSAGFWTWSVASYSQPGVAERLLRLQDEFGLDVNILLWCLWARDNYPAIRRKKALALIRKAEKWTGHVTEKLRNVRRWMKGMDLPVDSEAAATLRNDVKALELRSERLCQEMLEKRTRTFAADPEARTESPVDYVMLYLEHAGDTLESPPELSDKAGAIGAEELIGELETMLAGKDA